MQTDVVVSIMGLTMFLFAFIFLIMKSLRSSQSCVSASSTVTHYARCIACHVTYRVPYPIPGERFVCSICTRDSQPTPLIVPPLPPRTITTTSFPSVGIKRINSSLFEVASTDDVDAFPANMGRICKICCEPLTEAAAIGNPSINYKPAILLPCGHGGICVTCSDALLLSSGKCHACRAEISMSVTESPIVNQGRCVYQKMI